MHSPIDVLNPRADRTDEVFK